MGACRPRRRRTRRPGPRGGLGLARVATDRRSVGGALATGGAAPIPMKTPVVKPSSRHATLASSTPKPSSHTVPKTPPNPLKNDKEFLDHFPYLADPW